MNKRQRLKIAKKSGQKGGYLRAAKLSAKKRSAIARKAANARWARARSDGFGSETDERDTINSIR